ncbi:unnamed protein product [Paramecium pentaurelia]|uniref:Uncharacterized protein n=1 Tax=Paramecium pentaurelia TaxID=43138 RepID=A0A8S1TBU5_9CILI|nr:unnamed protein product [Paramecium pentaurelia]
MQNIQSSLEFFPYELIPKMTTNNRYCHAIAINHNNTIVMVEDRGNIKVFNLKNESLKLIQIIQQLGFSVSTINFFKSQQFFVSSSYMGDIIFRSSILKSTSKFLLKISENITQINCLLINSPQEDLIITGSADHAIRFYQSKSKYPLSWVCSQTLIVHLNCVQGLSLNEEGTKLISCGSDLKIIIMEGSNKQNWIVKQIIQTSWKGFRINFITNDIFIFQQGLRNELDFYMFNSQSGLYSLDKKLQVKGGQKSCYNLFPSKYVKSKQLLLVKNGEYVNFIRIINQPSSNQDLECTLVQAINFDTGLTFGTLSDDGQYLITWDYNSQQIKVRKPKRIV